MNTNFLPDELRRRLTPLRRAAEILSIPSSDLESALADLPHVMVGRVALFDIDELRRVLLSRARRDPDLATKREGSA